MRKIFSVLFIFALGFLCLGLSTSVVKADEITWDFTETFDNYPSISSSYGNNNFTGVEGIEWNVVGGRGDLGGYVIDGKGVMLNETSSSISATFPNGIDSFTIQHMKGFTGGTTRNYKIDVMVEGAIVTTLSIPLFGTSGEDKTIYDFTGSLKINGEVMLKIYPSAKGQATFDNFSWNEYKENKLSATVNQLFGPSNELPVTITPEAYGQDIVIPVEASVGGKDFQFAVVNGVINNSFVTGNNTLPVTENLEVSLVYASNTEHAVLFVDSNGKLLSNTWVSNGGTVSAPNVSGYSKPGFELSATPWLSNDGDTSLDNIDSSRVYTVQYEPTSNPVTINVNGTDTVYAYNQVVTVVASNPSFTAWVENGKVVSTNQTYKFTALVDRTLEESTTETSTLPLVTLTDDLKLREENEDLQTFVGQVELGEDDVLVEHGFVVTEDESLKYEDLTLENGTKARSNVLHEETNEFMMSFSTSYNVVRAYIIVRNDLDEINTYYSENQYSNWVEPTILEVKALENSTNVVFLGIVTGFDGSNIFVQDDTAAIKVIASVPENLAVGDKVRVSGVRNNSYGLDIIGSATVVILSSGNTLYSALEIDSVTDIIAEVQSMQFNFSELTIVSLTSSNLNLEDNNGNSISVYAPSGDMNTHIQNGVVGLKVDIVGAFVGWYNSNPQITITNVNQLVFLEPTDQEKVDLAKADLSIAAVATSSGIDLPLTGLYGTSISWASSHPDIITSSGAVNPPQTETNVTLTATITLNSATATRPFTVNVKPEGSLTEQLLYSYNFNDGGDNNNSGYASINLTTNVSNANDNPGGATGTTLWNANYANLSGTSWTRLGGKLESTEYPSTPTNQAFISTSFVYIYEITKIEILNAATFGTAGNVGTVYIQISTSGTDWTTVASTTNKSGDLIFDGLSIPANSYLKIAVGVSASSTNSGLQFNGLRVHGLK